MDASGTAPGTRRLTVRARAFVATAGAIGTPGLLLRSGTPDPYGVVGKRTFLHPVVVSAHPESPGGVVRLRDDGSPVLDYPFTPYRMGITCFAPAANCSAVIA
jgi:hypothetical protein